MGRKDSEKMPEAEPITTQLDLSLPNENLVEYVKQKGINMIVVHGSNNGTAEKYASELCKEAEARQYNGLTVDAEELFADDLPRLSEFDNMFIVFLMSTYDGKPSLNARKMYEWLNQETNIVPGLKYAVYGLGDMSYATQFNSIAKQFDERLESLGGKRLLSLGLGDQSSCMDDDFKDWRNKLWNAANKTICPVECSQRNTEGYSFGTKCQKRSLIDRLKESKATILVINVSKSDQTKSFSCALKCSALKNGFNSLVVSAAEINLDDMPKLCEIKNLVVLLCMPINCDGKPSCDTKKFYDWIHEGKGSLDGVRYAIFGVGSSKSDDSIVNKSKQLNEKLGILGGNCIYELGFGKEEDSSGESSIADDFRKWNDGLWTAIKQSCV